MGLLDGCCFVEIVYAERGSLLNMLDPVAEKIIVFLREIGLTVRLVAISTQTFLPGVSMEPGGLLVDPDGLKYPGDLLHEAGHLAVMMPEERASASENVGSDMGTEIGAQCWSYAAAVHLGMSPEVVFHPNGYKGAAATLIHNYGSGVVGVPLLQWMGLTVDAQRAAQTGEQPYPHMQRWLRESSPPTG
jgi:hypothetical protein